MEQNAARNAKLFDTTLKLSYEVIHAVEESEDNDVDLARKLWLHAATMRQMLLGTPTKFLASTKSKIVDNASIGILARSILDGFCQGFEIFHEHPISSDLQEYRYCAYMIRSYKLLTTNRSRTNTNEHTRSDQFIERYQEYDSRIQKTQHYNKLSTNQQKQSRLKGKVYEEKVCKGKLIYEPRNTAEIAEAAGISRKLVDYFYQSTSGDVHSDDLSVKRNQNWSETMSQESMFSLVIVTVCLSHYLILFANKYPEAKGVCEANQETYAQAVMLTKSTKTDLPPFDK